MKINLLAIMTLSAASAFPQTAKAQVALANPNWNITLTDYGYADLLFDNTPGFEGREYLCGEWGAAVAYEVGATPVAPQWLEPSFIYPDWTTNSAFHVVSPLSTTGVNADNLPIAQSMISNNQVEVTLRFEMLDTIVGTPMGTTAASAGGPGAFMSSNRYVLRQTYTLKNITASTLTNVQLFQLLHGLNSQRGVFDDRAYAGPLETFRHDVTLSGVDQFAAGAGTGLEDLIAFHSIVAPAAFEIGHYGIEGSGVDDHGIGKPSDGVHLSIENNWQTAPFSGRKGTDSFAPAQRWVAGAQRWTLGSLAPGQSTSFEIVLSILTGTKVPAGINSSGSCDGGSSVPGGLDYEFEDVSVEGSCFSDFSRADADEIAVHIAQGEFDAFTFNLPGMPAQLWEVEFSGSYSAAIHLTFGYDGTLLPAGLDESTLAVYQFTGGEWVKQTGMANGALDTIAITTTSLGSFVLGVDSGETVDINSSVLPPGSGTVAGSGSYAPATSVSLVAHPNTGFVFLNWTEGGTVVSSSPSYTFIAQANRALVASFQAVGGNRTISTVSTPANGGTTSGDGAYADDSNATVVATPAAGYKFSKWLENGASVRTQATYTFTVTGDRALAAKFKPVYTLTTSAEPPNGGEVEADTQFDPGDLAVLIANPADGYSFANWTENGVVISDEPVFEFNVTGNRTIVGHFAPGHRVDVIADPKSAGVVGGGGVYDGEVTVTATAKPDYVFLEWTDGGVTASQLASYTFTPTVDRTLVAKFAALPPLKFTDGGTGTLIVTWPAGATDWVLQESLDLDPGNWTVSTRPITVVDGQNQVVVEDPPARSFFRLQPAP